MGEKFVGLNRLLHILLGKLADIALGCIVFTVVFLVADTCIATGENVWADRLAPVAPDLLLTLFVFVFVVRALRHYVRLGVDFACNWFPHDAAARLGMMYLFDMGALIVGLCLLFFAAIRLPSAEGTWAWWRALSLLPAGTALVFDAALFLCGLLEHEDAYTFRRVPAYQRKLRRSERLRRNREAEYALRMQQSEAERDLLWSGVEQALPADSARLYLLNRQE